MKHRESRTVGGLCLALALLFFILGDYPLGVPLAVYGGLCFVIPHKLFPTREQLEAARRRQKRKGGGRPPMAWYQSPVIVGVIIASIIVAYYVLK